MDGRNLKSASIKRNSFLSFLILQKGSLLLLSLIITLLFPKSMVIAAPPTMFMYGFTSFDTCYNSIRYFTYGLCTAAQDGDFRFRYGVTNNQDTQLNYKIYSYQDAANPLVQFDSFTLNPHSSTTRYVTRALTICGDMIICGNTSNGISCDLNAGYNWQTIPACPNTPTPTSIPTPVCNTLSQTSFSGTGTPLINDYNTTQYKGSPQYTQFTATNNGKISKTEIYGNLDRNVAKGNKVLQCKITNSTGSVTLGESNTNNGPFTTGNSWMSTGFTTPVNVTSGSTYRLYCKVNNLAGGGYIYWLDNYKNRTDKTYKISLCN